MGELPVTASPLPSRRELREKRASRRTILQFGVGTAATAAFAGVASLAPASEVFEAEQAALGLDALSRTGAQTLEAGAPAADGGSSLGQYQTNTASDIAAQLEAEQQAALELQAQLNANARSGTEMLSGSPVSSASPAATSEVQWPVGREYVAIPYGPRPCGGVVSCFHNGVDFNGWPRSTPMQIQVVAAGTVVFSGTDAVYGEHVIVEHNIQGEPFRTLYGHMAGASREVQVGQVIERGTVVGVAGTTGMSTGIHLHLEVRIGNGVQRIDPLPWLNKYAG